MQKKHFLFRVFKDFLKVKMVLELTKNFIQILPRVFKCFSILIVIHNLNHRHGISGTNTKSLAKEFSKILIFEYFVHLKTGFDVFFDADSKSPRMT